MSTDFMSRHLTPEELARFVDGDPELAGVASFAQHLDACDECATQLLGELDRSLAATNVLAGHRAPRSRPAAAFVATAARSDLATPRLPVRSLVAAFALLAVTSFVRVLGAARSKHELYALARAGVATSARVAEFFARAPEGAVAVTLASGVVLFVGLWVARSWPHVRLPEEVRS